MVTLYSSLQTAFETQLCNRKTYLLAQKTPSTTSTSGIIYEFCQTPSLCFEFKTPLVLRKNSFNHLA
jgi:hypothetical protein